MTGCDALFMLYSIVFSFAMKLLRIVPSINKKLSNRPNPTAIKKQIMVNRSQYDDCVVFFCSSAGEYEQAKPIIDRLKNNKRIYPYVIFFSESGPRFVHARQDVINFTLSPASDSVWDWGQIFAALRPTVVAVVRHELWPGFLVTARAYAKHLTLINASKSIGEQQSYLARWLRKYLFRFFDVIHTVSPSDEEFYKLNYHLSKLKITTTGDSKYDRVVERVNSRQEHIVNLKLQLIRDGILEPKAKYLVVGSAYSHELKLILEIKPFPLGWQIIIVPHILDANYISALSHQIAQAGYSSCLYSSPQGIHPFIIIDKLGLLSDLYGIADKAIVGGGIHNKVHNVIEPAACSVPVAFGPNYHNSSEAKLMVEENLAAVFHTSNELNIWWQTFDSRKPRQISDFVRNLTGASDRLVQEWSTLMGTS